MLMGIDGKPIAPSGPVSPWPQPHPDPQRKRRRGMRRWPLFLIASPAAVAIWSGWVALGQMCGFGPVNLLPGIGSGFTLNTAITLPIGVEAYGAYALGAWLLPGAPARARRFARKSAVGSLALGVTGQVIYHLLAAAHRTRAPWPVVMVVACMPVATLGFGAALTHLMRDEDDDSMADDDADDSDRQDDSGRQDRDTGNDDTGGDSGGDENDDSDRREDDSDDDSRQPPKPPSSRPRKAPRTDKVAAILKRSPDLSDADVAKRAGVSVRTVQRRREAARKTAENATTARSTVVAIGDRRQA